MKQILNTLYVTTQGAYVHLQNQSVQVDVDQTKKLQVPLHHLGGLVTLGNVMISPFLIQAFSKEGRNVAMLDRNGRFICRMVGPMHGNVILRRAQHQASLNETVAATVATAMIAAKIKNSRYQLQRSARDADNNADKTLLQEGAAHLGHLLHELAEALPLPSIRGVEGEAAKVYFGLFPLLIKPGLREDFPFDGRNRRPPRDRVNAVLSFLYTLLLNDCLAALEGVGMDPQIGFLHVDRSGRPALALDMMEEFRSLTDRLAVTLINRRQVAPEDFEARPGGAVLLNDKGRKTVIVAYQNRKQEELTHPLFKEKVSYGLLPHIQARLLARHIRGETAHYLPMVFE